MIDKVLVLSLRRCVERHWAWLGASQMRKIPLEIVGFFEGYDGSLFSDIDDVSESASADGFGFVEEYALGTVTEYTQQTPESVSQVWNFARILRYIAERDETCLVLADDKMLSLNFAVVNMISNELLCDPETEFYAFQLSRRGDPNEFDHVSKDRFEDWAFSQQVFQAVFCNEIVSYRDFFLKPGIIGYEESFILSPAGAAWLLDALCRADDFYIYFDHFLCYGLPAMAGEAIESGKGIWTPAEQGYSFVSEIMPMGTTTHWAPEGTLHYEASIAKVEVPWIEPLK